MALNPNDLDYFHDSSLIHKQRMNGNADDDFGMDTTNTGVTFDSGKFNDAGVFVNNLETWTRLNNYAIGFDETPFTISFFFKKTTAATYSYMLSGGYYNSGIDNNYLIVVAGYGDDKIRLTLRDSDSGLGQRDIVATDDIVMDTWYHVAVTGDTANIKLYVDGVLLGSVQTHTGNAYLNFGSALIENANLDSTLGGMIDQIDYFNRPLTNSEILELSNMSGSAPTLFQDVHEVEEKITVHFKDVHEVEALKNIFLFKDVHEVEGGIAYFKDVERVPVSNTYFRDTHEISGNNTIYFNDIHGVFSEYKTKIITRILN